MPSNEVIQTVQIAARIPSDLREQIEEIAKSHDRPFSYELRQALKAHVKANEQDAA